MPENRSGLSWSTDPRCIRQAYLAGPTGFFCSLGPVEMQVLKAVSKASEFLHIGAGSNFTDDRHPDPSWRPVSPSPRPFQVQYPVEFGICPAYRDSIGHQAAQPLHQLRILGRAD